MNRFDMALGKTPPKIRRKSLRKAMDTDDPWAVIREDMEWLEENLKAIDRTDIMKRFAKVLRVVALEIERAEK
jgi:hypothetical protein